MKDAIKTLCCWLLQDGDGLYALRMNKAAPAIAQQIAAGARSLARAIETRFESKPQDGQPLFVVLGENHAQAAHQILQMQAICGLWEKGYRVAIGHERPHDSALKEALNVLRSDKGQPSNAQRLKALLDDDYGRMTLAHSGFAVLFSAYSHDLAAYAWMRRGISMAFNDAARTQAERAEDVRFNMQDSVTQQVMTDHDIIVTDKMGLGDAPAMHLRNRVMVRKAQEHAKQQQAEIYVQLCGNAHVAGIYDSPFGKDYLYEQSLTALFKQQGQSAIGVPVYGDAGSGAIKIRPEAVRAGDVMPLILPVSAPFRGDANRHERIWLAAVMNALEPDFDIDRALVFPDWKTYFAGKGEHEKRYAQRRRAGKHDQP